MVPAGTFEEYSGKSQMAVVEQTMVDVDDAGWYPDPTHQHNLRYFDGTTWTDHVTHHGPTPCSGCNYGDPSSLNN